ncbi:glycoside hydrolase family 5 protein [soil metagenome]
MISAGQRTAMSFGSALCFTLLAACQVASSSQAVAHDRGQQWHGVNLSGGEFAAETLPGKAGTNYVYPDAGVAEPFIAQGMDTVRMPVLWERIQPEPFKPLSESEMMLIDQSITALGGFGTIIFDIHNYGYYRKARLDTAPDGSAMLADVWKRLAERYKDKPAIAFGIMNEPYDIDAQAWRKIVDRSVAAIRKTGATNLILVPGTRWTGAHSWLSGGSSSNAAAFQDFQDPGNNFLFELHQYLDADSSGTKGECVGAKTGSERLAEVTQWLRARKAGALLGEFGGGPGTTCLAALDDMLTYMDSNSDVWRGWTYWAGGAWWGDYPLSVQPGEDGKPKPQMEVLVRHTSR